MEVQVNKSVVREAVIRALSEENLKNREAEFVISTETVDTYGTVFKLSGWNLERYQKNPIVFYAHKSYSDNPDMVIGTSEVFVENDQLIGRVRFEEEETNPLAEKIWKKVQAGTLRMASIGANPIRGHWGDEKLGEDKDVIYFDESVLLEWSIVPLGSNPDALKREVEIIESLRAEKAKVIEVIDAVPVLCEKRESAKRKLLLNKSKYC